MAKAVPKPDLVWPSLDSLLNLSPEEILARFAPSSSSQSQPRPGSSRRTSTAPSVRKVHSNKNSSTQPGVCSDNPSAIQSIVSSREDLNRIEKVNDCRSDHPDEQIRKMAPSPNCNSSKSRSNLKLDRQTPQRSGLSDSDGSTQVLTKANIIGKGAFSGEKELPAKKRRRLSHFTDQSLTARDTPGQLNQVFNRPSGRKKTDFGEENSSSGDNRICLTAETAKIARISEPQPKKSLQELNPTLPPPQAIGKTRTLNIQEQDLPVDIPSSGPRKRRRVRQSTPRSVVDDSERTPRFCPPISENLAGNKSAAKSDREQDPSIDISFSENHKNRASQPTELRSANSANKPPSFPREGDNSGLDSYPNKQFREVKSLRATDTPSVVHLSIPDKSTPQVAQLCRKDPLSYQQASSMKLSNQATSPNSIQPNAIFECNSSARPCPEKGMGLSEAPLQNSLTKLVARSGRGSSAQGSSSTLSVEKISCASDNKSDRFKPIGLTSQPSLNFYSASCPTPTKVAEIIKNPPHRITGSLTNVEDCRMVREWSQQPSLDMSETSVSRSSQISGSNFLQSKKKRNKSKHKIKKLQKRLQAPPDQSLSTPMEMTSNETFTPRLASVESVNSLSSALTSPCSKETYFNIQLRSSPPRSTVDDHKHFGRWELSLPCDRKVPETVLARMNQFLDEAVCAGFAKPWFDRPTPAGSRILPSSPTSVSKGLTSKVELPRFPTSLPSFPDKIAVTSNPCDAVADSENPVTASQKFAACLTDLGEGRSTRLRNSIPRCLSGCSSSLSEDINNTVMMALGLEQVESNGFSAGSSGDQTCQNPPTTSSQFENAPSSASKSEGSIHSFEVDGTPALSSRLNYNLKPKPVPSESETSVKKLGNDSSKGIHPSTRTTDAFDPPAKSSFTPLIVASISSDRNDHDLPAQLRSSESGHTSRHNESEESDAALTDPPDTTLKNQPSLSNPDSRRRKPQEKPSSFKVAQSCSSPDSLSSTRSSDLENKSSEIPISSSAHASNSQKNRMTDIAPAQQEAYESSDSSCDDESEISDEDSTGQAETTLTHHPASLPKESQAFSTPEDPQESAQPVKQPQQVSSTFQNQSANISAAAPASSITMPNSANLTPKTKPSRSSDTSSEEESETSYEDSIGSPNMTATQTFTLNQSALIPKELKQAAPNEKQTLQESSSQIKSTSIFRAAPTSQAMPNPPAVVTDLENRPSKEKSSQSSELSSVEAPEKSDQGSVDAPEVLLTNKFTAPHCDLLLSRPKHGLPTPKIVQQKSQEETRPPIVSGSSSKSVRITTPSSSVSTVTMGVSDDRVDGAISGDPKILECFDGSSEDKSESSNDSSLSQQGTTQTNQSANLNLDSSTLKAESSLSLLGIIDNSNQNPPISQSPMTSGMENKTISPNLTRTDASSDTESEGTSDDNCAPPSAQRHLKLPSPESSSADDQDPPGRGLQTTDLAGHSPQALSIPTSQSMIGFQARGSVSGRRKTLDAFRPVDFRSNRPSSTPLSLPDRSKEFANQTETSSENTSSSDDDDDDDDDESDSSNSEVGKVPKNKSKIPATNGLPAHKLAGVATPSDQKRRKSRPSVAQLWAKEEAKINNAKKAAFRAP